jgi:hypothetical protein
LEPALKTDGFPASAAKPEVVELAKEPKPELANAELEVFGCSVDELPKTGLASVVVVDFISVSEGLDVSDGSS